MAPTPRPAPAWTFPLLCLALLALSLAPPPGQARPLPTARVPLEVLATGFHDLQGLAVAPDGTLVATDRHGGLLLRVTPQPAGGAAVAVAMAGLQEPRGVAIGPDEAVYVVEAGAGQVLRLDPAGTLPVRAGLREPTWLAVGPEGTLYLTAQGQQEAPAGGGSPAAGKGQGKAQDAGTSGTAGHSGVQLLRCPPGAPQCDVLLAGLHAPGGLWSAADGTVCLSLEKRAHESERQGSTLLCLDPAAPGALTGVLGPGVKDPAGPVVDGLGAWLLGARHAYPWGPLGTAASGTQGLLVKAGAGGPPTLLGSGFGAIRALALEPAGHLVVATADTLYRLRAPAAPTLAPPVRVTSQPTLALTGTADPGAQVTVQGGTAPAQAGAHPATGAFTVTVPLRPNTAQALAVYATSVGGQGLTSPAATCTVTHDDQPPETIPLTGPPPLLGEPEATATVTGQDNLTPPTALTYTWRLDGGPWSVPAPLTLVRLTGLAPGLHTLEIAAEDLAGTRDPTPAAWTFTVQSLQLAITTPQAGDTVPAGPLLVQGTVEAGGQPVGVTVNGVVAGVSGTAWGVLLTVPVGQWVLTATATTASGATVRQTQALEVVPGPAGGLGLRPYPPGGPAPLPVTFQMQNNTGRALVQYTLDLDGDGTAEVTTSSPEALQGVYTAAGLHRARLRATDDQGATHEATALVAVWSRAELVAQHQASYTGLKEALRQGDIPAALTFLHSRARARYEAVFRAIPPEHLTAVDQYLAEAVPVELGYLEAEYEIRRVRNGQVYGYPLFFWRDTDGLWRLGMF